MAGTDLIDQAALAGLASRSVPQRHTITGGLEVLHDEVEKLHTLLTRAEDALSNVLLPVGPEAQMALARGEVGGPSSPHGASLDAAINKLLDVQRRLGALIERIDA